MEPDSPYQDIIPGSVYYLYLQAVGGATLTGSTVKLDLDSPNGTRVTKTISSFTESGTLATATLSTTDTTGMGDDPGGWTVCWRLDGVVVGDVKRVNVEPLPAGDLA